MNKYSIAAAAGALGFGAAGIAVPDVLIKLFGVTDDQLTPVARMVIRGEGVRNLTIGSMLLSRQGRKAVRAALPVFVLAELAAAGLVISQDGVKPMVPGLTAGASLAVAALVWQSRE